MMNMNNCVWLAILLLLLCGCAKTDNDTQAVRYTAAFPDYSIINAPSKDVDMQWYVSDFFRRVEQWELETTNYDDLKMGMYELSQFPGREATQAQRNAASKLIEDSFDAVVRNGWLTKENGLNDGYEKMFGDPVHFVNTDYVFDGETLNPDKPEVLMYYKTREGDFLLGVMFLAIGERGPQIAGPLSKWHYHIDRRMCYEKGVLPIGAVNEEGICETGVPNIRSPEMLHVWFFDHPEGRFATRMGLTEDLLNTGIEEVLRLQKGRL